MYMYTKHAITVSVAFGYANVAVSFKHVQQN